MPFVLIKKKKKEHSLTEPIYFETGVNHIYPPKYWGFKNIKGSITRNAIDYTFELEEKGIIEILKIKKYGRPNIIYITGR